MAGKAKKGKKNQDYVDTKGAPKKGKGIRKGHHNKDGENSSDEEELLDLRKASIDKSDSSIIDRLNQKNLPPSKIQQLLSLKRKFEEKQKERIKTQEDFQLHQKNYFSLKEQLQMGEESFEKSKAQVRNSQREIFQNQMKRFHQLSQNPFTFQKEESFEQFYAQLCSLPGILENCCYCDPLQSFQLCKIVPACIAGQFTGKLKEILNKHFSLFPYVTTNSQNLDIILPLLGWELEQQQDSKQLSLICFPSLFIKSTKIPYVVQYKIAEMACCLFLNYKNALFAKKLHKIIQSNSRKHKQFFTERTVQRQMLFINELIYKGLSSIRFINYPKKGLKGLLASMRIFLNTFQIEEKCLNTDNSAQILLPFYFQVLVRELSNYVFESIEFCYDKNKTQLKESIRIHEDGKDIGVQMERELVAEGFVEQLFHQYRKISEERNKEILNKILSGLGKQAIIQNEEVLAVQNVGEQE